MSKPIKDALPFVKPPVLDAALLQRICDLNFDYLRLLQAEHDQPNCAAQLQHFPPKFLSAIARFDMPAMQRMARTPYTLFSFGFEDRKFWRVACEDEDTLLARYGANSSVWLQGPFFEVALAFAWHVANCNRLAARVLFAMPDASIDLVAGTSLVQIRRIAIDYAGLLLPRWPTNPSFWPDLARFAQTDDRTRLRNVTLLGTQLIAAQLQIAAGEDRGLRAAPRLQHAARLRGRKLRLKLGSVS
jgi:hypothetical protein